MTLWLIEPGQAVGPWRLGASIDELRTELAHLGEVTPAPRGPGLAVVRGDGLAVFITVDSSDNAVEIEIARPGPPGDPGDLRCLVAGTDVFASPAHTVISAVAAHTAVAADDDPDTVSAPEWGLSFWRGGDDHDVVDDQGVPLYFQAVLLSQVP